MTYFRNLTLNKLGVERNLYELILDGDINTALALMEDNDIEVDKAISEYNPQTHSVMRRPNKFRDGDEPYITEKLPRTRQRYINEIELFFLLGKPIQWKKLEGSDEAFKVFSDFIRDSLFDSNMRSCKRLAGAETESAKLYHIFRDDENNIDYKAVVLARSTGYKLRPMFDQYKNMTAFACGYQLREGGSTIQHWDIYTKDMIFYTKKKKVGWDIEQFKNPIGKIPVLYYRQLKAWDGVQPRIEREEMLDSKLADTNNYFADPMASATADVIDSMADPDKPGRLIQLTGTNSKFEYINPPTNSQTRESERQTLEDSILFDSFTPDFSFEKLKGLGSLSGVAIKNSMALGRIKRENRIEIYGEMVTREKNVIIEVLCLLHPEMEKDLRELKVDFEFSEPFDEDKTATWSAIGNLFGSGIASLETCVGLLSLTDAPQEEIDKIRLEAMEKIEYQLQMQEESAKRQQEMTNDQE